MDSEEYEYVTRIFGLHVGVNKVGGGTLDESYFGQDWEVTVCNGDEIVYDRQIMRIGMEGTHVKAAFSAATFASEEINGE